MNDGGTKMVVVFSPDTADIVGNFVLGLLVAVICLKIFLDHF